MSKVQNNICNIFSTFHDGSIVDCKGDLNKLTLTIQCNYLAELIHPDFENFYLDLIGINKLDFDPWNLDRTALKNYEEFLKADLEILSAELKDDFVWISCNQHDTNLDYCGGDLSILATGFNLFDHDRRQMTIEQLDSICRIYWDKFRSEE